MCFKSNFEAARERKVSRYTDLVEEAEQHGYTCDILTVEVGSRGMVEVLRLDRLKRMLKVQGKGWAEFLVRLAETAMKESHKIWNMRNKRFE